ncbi:MAG: DivIVA domain-containing protein [candidate division KSB1 bacterium]|nr:DivIVA domain-containing protein [candidate division KSB1 bacterium]MDZ7385464.1 DivIVA domain-containing protein [candidate division KSB1 bacterium]MDZ7391805.1 DivIVA domain-containing protein [candidate division KSB1 bacterium]
MRLTPLEIRKQEFHRSMRGFDVDEVEMFLDMVAEQFETLLRERNALNEEVVKLRTQLRDYQQVEKTLQETLMNAQQNLNESREASRRQAELIVREAELRAEEIVEEARNQLQQLKSELVMLRAEKASFVKRLKQLLQAQVELLDVLSSDDLDLKRVRAALDNEEEEPSEQHEAQPAPEPRIVGLEESSQPATPAAGEQPAAQPKPSGPPPGRLSDEFII